MKENLESRVEIEAARRLVIWKARFAEAVAGRARQVASESSDPRVVTVEHYRLAARYVLKERSNSILQECDTDVRSKAA